MTTKTQKKRKIFVVHGRNLLARDAMFSFLRSIDLHPIEWSEARRITGRPMPYTGEILDRAFSAAQAIVVLLTPDDLAFLDQELLNDHDPEYERNPTPQARPNVLFEAGMAMGRCPERTIIVEAGRLRPFSDIAGLNVVRLNDTTERRQELAHRLIDAGCQVNLSGTSWHNEGKFGLKDLGISTFSVPEFKSKLVDSGEFFSLSLSDVDSEDIRGFIDDKKNEPFLRAKAFTLACRLGIIDNNYLEQLIIDETPLLRKTVVDAINEFDFNISPKPLAKLMKDPIQQVALDAIEVATRIIASGSTKLDSRIFVEASSHKEWQVRYRAIVRIIRADDNSSISSLNAFHDTTYHLARNAIRKYFLRLHDEGQLTSEDKKQAIRLISSFIEDGKSSDITQKKLVKALEILQS